MAEHPGIFIDPRNGVSVRLLLYRDETHLGFATGFIVERNERVWLITNWHVLSGVHPDTGVFLDQNGAIPNKVGVVYNVKGDLNKRVMVSEVLDDSSNGRLWKEHPRGREIDVAALQLSNPNVITKGKGDDENSVDLMPLDLALAEADIPVRPAMDVSIIGYPIEFDEMENFWPVWKIGHIATEPEINYSGKPLFLIDATTRSGMSGSPVYAIRYGGYPNSSGRIVYRSGGPAVRFLGIYSAHLEGKELGFVWKPSAITETVDA